MKLSIVAGATSQTINIFIQDSSSATGAGLTGLVFNTASLTAYYALSRAAAVSITLATLAAVTSAYSSGGFKEIDATNMPGWYRFDIPDAALASGRFVGFLFKGAANMAPLPIEIELTAWNNQDAVRGGMTALPNAAAEAAGGLYTRGTGAGQINQANNGQIDANAARLGGTTQTGRDVGTSVLLSSGTGTGQLDFTSGVVKANLAQILGTALTETAGQIAAGFKKLFDVAAPVLTAASINQTGDNYGRLGAPAGASVSADVAAVKALLPTALVGGRMDASVGAMAANVVTAAAIADAALDRATFAADTGMQSVRSNTAAAGAAGTITLDASASATDSFYVGDLIILTGNTGVGQARVISGYVGSTKVATLDRNWVTNPDNTTTFAILGNDKPKLDSSLQTTTTLAAAAVQAIWDALTSALTTSGSIGKWILDKLDAAVTSRLAPTTAGRTLDVTATGAAGIDWSNIENPGTPVSLLATEVSDVANGVFGGVEGNVLVLNVTQRPEPGQTAPAATLDALSKLDWLYKWARNKVTQDATTLKMYDDAGTTVDQKATVSDDGTTFTRGEIGSGP